MSGATIRFRQSTSGLRRTQYLVFAAVLIALPSLGLRHWPPVIAA
jgi:hypothetical protein